MYCELLWIGFLLDNGFNLPTDGVCRCSWFFNFFLFSPPLLIPGCVFPSLFPQAVTLMELPARGCGEARGGWLCHGRGSGGRGLHWGSISERGDRVMRGHWCELAKPVGSVESHFLGLFVHICEWGLS